MGIDDILKQSVFNSDMFKRVTDEQSKIEQKMQRFKGLLESLEKLDIDTFNIVEDIDAIISHTKSVNDKIAKMMKESINPSEKSETKNETDTK